MKMAIASTKLMEHHLLIRKAQKITYTYFSFLWHFDSNWSDAIVLQVLQPF